MPKKTTEEEYHELEDWWGDYLEKLKKWQREEAEKERKRNELENEKRNK